MRVKLLLTDKIFELEYIIEEMTEAVKVMVRCRPMNRREK